jgi:hypothetical protein
MKAVAVNVGDPKGSSSSVGDADLSSVPSLPVKSQDACRAAPLIESGVPSAGLPNPKKSDSSVADVELISGPTSSLKSLVAGRAEPLID